MSDSQATQVPLHPSVLAPVSRALAWTGFVLFRPFDITKWFVLGFCGWLAWLGEKGGGGYSWHTSSEELSYKAERVGEWVFEHLALFIALVVAFVIVGLVLGVLLLWLSSRGKFMFLDGVVHDRGAVVEPWQRFRAAGNSLFGFRIVMALLAIVSFGIVVTLMIATLLPLGLGTDEPGPAAITFIVAWVAVLLAMGFSFVLVAMAVTDFIVPIMWVRGGRVMEAWSEFLSLFSANLGTFILYVLFKIVVAVAMAILACVVTCVTCCIAALPYIGTVLLLPLYVFHRSYSMYFLGQFGADYASLAPLPPPATASSAPPPAPPVPPAPPAVDPRS